MKVLFLFSIVTLSIFLNIHTYGQESVEKSMLSAKRFQRKPDSDNFKDFKTHYLKAEEEIKEILQRADTAMYGFDAVADNAPAWIQLYQVLDNFEGGKVFWNGDNVELNIVDYAPVYAEAKEKAAKVHFDQAMKIIQSSQIFENRMEAIPHFEKAKKYSDVYNNQISDSKAKIYYDEGLRLYNEDTNFIIKLETVTFFDNALKEVSPYKDARELVAKLYSGEAERLYGSDNLQDLKKALTYYDKAMEYIPDYNSAGVKKMLVKQKGASILYNQAQEKEKEQTYGAQNEAANIYKRAEGWMNTYKDASERAKKAEALSILKVLFQDANGNILNPSQSIDNLSSVTKRYIEYPKLNTMNADISNTAILSKVAGELGSGFILVKLNEKRITYNDAGVKAENKTIPVEEYFLIKRNVTTGKSTESEITKEEYDEGLKEQKNTKSSSGSNYRLSYKTYTGTLNITTSVASIEASCPVEIWDVRDPQHPKKIKDIIASITTSDTKVNTSYSGSMKVKPELVKEGSVMSKDELMSLAKNNRPTISSIVDSMQKEIAQALNQIDFVRVE